ncbi:hypothetical protein N7537_000166 [Penicillium hordei]|uniref:Uncharacterized protein n=1 Tax=Penicillium hordei TaxID=40994 RepID=A0AAD6ED27_9EURO|nr:uncharacterized protein N7537_000166 [Penicillium hordei]KAJ5615052.1 hypothetical protein N7537_000166 [Penicillium hordei]
MNIEQWLEDITKRIEEPVTPLGLTMPEKCLGSLEQQSDMDKGLLERDNGREDKIVHKIRTLKETVRRQDERLRKSELQEDIVQGKITSLQEQLSVRDSFQQHSDLNDRLNMHERLLEVADQQINTQQELIKHLLEVQASTSRQLAFITQKLSQQAEQSMEQPQMEEAEGVQSNPGRVSNFTDASDYVLVSEDKATTS